MLDEAAYPTQMSPLLSPDGGPGGSRQAQRRGDSVALYDIYVDPAK
jgi:hypothetical protein